ncbi:hypothetical protein GCM10028787_01970 [Brachybacterium horti]
MDHGAVRWGSGVRMLGAAGMVAMVVTSCGSAMPPGPFGPTWITSWAGDDQAMDAALHGTVGEVDGCLVIVDDTGAAHYPVVEQGDGRPHGWSEGDRLDMGGGEVSLPAGGPHPDSWTVPEACRGAEDLWVVAPE